MAQDRLPESKRKAFVRLPNFLQIVRIVAFLIIIFFLFAVWRFPRFFDFVINRDLFLIIITSFIVINSIYTYFIPRMVRLGKFYFVYLYNILWAVFLIGIVYTTGGVWSSFGILMVFPVLTTAFNLEADA